MEERSFADEAVEAAVGISDGEESGDVAAGDVREMAEGSERDEEREERQRRYG